MTNEEIKRLQEKYTPSDVDALKAKIRSRRFTFVIKDPFPEHTAHKQMGALTRFGDGPRDVSIHEAWMIGFNFAWSLIEEDIK